MSYILLCRCEQVVLKLVLLCIQGFEASLSLLFSCLLWVISPPFSCISRLVLGGGERGFHSLFHLLPLLSAGGSVVICWWVSSSSRYTGVHSSHLLFFVISWRAKAKWFKTVGVYSIVFKVPTHREEIVNPLGMYSINYGISPN